MSISKLRKSMRGWFAKVLWGGLVVIFFGGVFVGFGRMGSNSSGSVEVAPDVVARVSKDAIRRAEFNAALGQQLEMAKYFGGSSVTTVEQTKQRALDQIVDQTLKFQAAKREKVRIRGREVDEKIGEYVQQEYDQAKSQASSPKLFEREIRKKHGSVAKLKSEIRSRISPAKVKDRLRIEKLEAKIKQRVEVTEKEYKDSRKKIKARVIMVKPEPELSTGADDVAGKSGKAKGGGSEAARKLAAKAKADNLLKQLKGGADFSKVAKQNSDDPTSAEKGGDVGEIGLKEKTYFYGDKFDEVAFSLNPGTLSNVFWGEDGYMIVRVDSEKLDLPEDYSQSKYKCLEKNCKNEWSDKPGVKTCPKCKKEAIRKVGDKKQEYIDQYKSQKEGEVWSAYTEKLKEHAKVVVLDPELKAYKQQTEGKIKEAVALYEEALKFVGGEDPFIEPAPIYYNLAMLLKQEGKTKEAMTQLQQALTYEESAGLRMEMAKLLKEQGKRKDAVEELKLAVDLADQEPSVRNELAFLLRDVGEKKLAAEMEEKAKANPGGGLTVNPGGM
ncbi:MAG: hypothetical protein AUJ92_06870 [Armatimonadetes bacterium CG2_30_59_28]|nr:hypothetical protein [Armatimonadota bacterium]OIO96075.1 MAG: hypothetical protein AUJ92_06870 [Armatimonadetes bacterium CG2_30_59_28]PIU65645.1 MAG: hypothetical protein COS85_08065 [Armatimonadetes bacterium CG07_land_8_20_14_0_80_59_28]PIX44062.1 MAG: hypothetical protein COZ56_05530 [Armatimonadetes bacterium CG_4_8_14_3_um_filter_58_9]PIY48464.1 MAG: hypothetical protein COZ05_03020 [Armatimonadetes bacterium CG_4_10_14_3_um_filter_59_10]